MLEGEKCRLTKRMSDNYEKRKKERKKGGKRKSEISEKEID